MMKGAKTWEEMRAELPSDIQRHLDQVADRKAEARKAEQKPEARPRGTKPAA